MKMLAPELSPATVFWSQIETKIAKCDIGEAQRDPWVSECLLLDTNSAIFQLYHGENKLIFKEMMMRSALF